MDFRRNPADLRVHAAAVGHLLTDSTGCQAALARASHDHSWTALANQYIKLYQR